MFFAAMRDISAVDFELALGVGEIERRERHDGGLRHIAEQRIDIRRADLREHLRAVVGGERVVTHIYFLSVMARLVRATQVTQADLEDFAQSLPE